MKPNLYFVILFSWLFAVVIGSAVFVTFGLKDFMNRHWLENFVMACLYGSVLSLPGVLGLIIAAAILIRKRVATGVGRIWMNCILIAMLAGTFFLAFALIGRELRMVTPGIVPILICYTLPAMLAMNLLYVLYFRKGQEDGWKKNEELLDN